jgi:asparagine synthase (glutamine-hydrolysing)
MINILSHRGPDGSSSWRNESVGLGHLMLWSTPESLNETLPLIGQDGILVITADVRLDNRDELINILRLPGQPSNVITDSQIILAAYEKWHENCTEHLLGDFAFVIWDHRQQTLFCARDHFGVKPFFYSYLPGHFFIFASEIKAICCLEEVACRLNEVKIGEYLELVFEDTTNTFYEDVQRLAPAHSITVNQAGLKGRSYWSLDPDYELHLDNDEAYAEAFLEIFTEAVSCRMRSTYSLGSMLSGGLDSSSVACIAREQLKRWGYDILHTFSATVDSPEADERAYVEAVLAQGNFTHHNIDAAHLSPFDDLDRILWHQDEPFYGPNFFLHWAVWKAAVKNDVHVLLDGIAGDSVVSYGHLYLAELADSWRWFTLATELKGIASKEDYPLWRLLPSYIWHLGLRPKLREQVRRARQVSGNIQTHFRPLNPIINADFAKRIDLEERTRLLEGNRQERAKTEREEHYRELTSGAIPSVVEIIDRGAAALCIEARFPFLDRRLVEFCLALPPTQKFYRGWTRLIVRRALVTILPESIRWRDSKGNYGPNLERSLLRFEQERLEKVILQQPQDIEIYINVDTLRQYYQEFTEQSADENAVRSIWLAVMLASWLEL